MIEQSDHGPVRTLRLDAGRLNVLTTEAVSELRAGLREAETSPSIRALVLLGRDDAFCAGLDTETVATQGPAADELLLGMAELLRALYGSSIPIVAATQGHAVAAGAMLLLASDVRLGAPGRYKIGFSEMSVGLPLPALPVLLARDRLDPRRLQEATVLGRLFPPEAAVEVGFLDRLAPADQLVAEAAEEAARLAKLDPAAYAETLAVVRGATLRSLDQLSRRSP